MQLWAQGVSSITSSMISTLMLAATSLVSSLLMFSILRSTVLPILYRLPIIHGLLRSVLPRTRQSCFCIQPVHHSPFVAHFLRPTYTITFVWAEFDLIIRAFSLSLSTQILWDITSTMFDAVFSMVSIRLFLCHCGIILTSLPAGLGHRGSERFRTYTCRRNQFFRPLFSGGYILFLLLVGRRFSLVDVLRLQASRISRALLAFNRFRPNGW